MRSINIIALVVMAFAIPHARANVTVFTNKESWQQAVGSATFIGFTGFANNTIITNQYAAMGVMFTDGNDFVQVSPSWLSDGAGLLSVDFVSPYGGRVHLAFNGTRNAVALDFHGSILVELYADNRLIHTTIMYSAAFTPFVGLRSRIPFDSIIIYDGDDEAVAIDNLYIGPAVPAPGALLALFASTAAIGIGGRRRA